MRPLNHECSIFPISECQIEGTDGWLMLQRFKNAGSHDGLHYVFAGVPENPTNPTRLPKVEKELPDRANQHAFAVANLGKKDGLFGTKSEIHSLYIEGILGDINVSD